MKGAYKDMVTACEGSCKPVTALLPCSPNNPGIGFTDGQHEGTEGIEGKESI